MTQHRCVRECECIVNYRTHILWAIGCRNSDPSLGERESQHLSKFFDAISYHTKRAPGCLQWPFAFVVRDKPLTPSRTSIPQWSDASLKLPTLGSPRTDQRDSILRRSKRQHAPWRRRATVAAKGESKGTRLKMVSINNRRRMSTTVACHKIALYEWRPGIAVSSQRTKPGKENENSRQQKYWSRIVTNFYLPWTLNPCLIKKVSFLWRPWWSLCVSICVDLEFDDSCACDWNTKGKC